MTAMKKVANLGKSLSDVGTIVGKPMSEIPGPRSLPFIGSSYKYLPIFGEYKLNEWADASVKKYQKYGRLVREEIFPGLTMVHVFDPDDVRVVSKYDGKFPHRFPFEAMLKYRKDNDLPVGLTNLNGEAWYDLRMKAQTKMMRPRSVSAYLGAMESVAEDMVSKIRFVRNEDGEVEDCLQEFYRWAMESIGIVCFDTRIGVISGTDLEADEFIRNVGKFFESLIRCQLAWPFHKRLKTKTYRTAMECMEKLWSISMKYVNNSLMTSAGRQAIDSTRAAREDGLSLLLYLLTSSDLNKNEVLVLVSDFLLAGVDTTAHTIAFALYLLAKNPDKQEKLFAEIQQFAPKGQPVLPEAIDKMTYLKAVEKETARVLPTVEGTMRTLTADVLLSGYLVKKGANVFTHNSVAGKLKEYFPEPEKFIPERWLRNNNESEKIHPFAVLNFGYGARACIGRRFAQQELYLGLIKILQNFTVEYHYEDMIQVQRMINMPKVTPKFKFIDR
ncbi:unnamed protein product [Dimorphilus gyrociliatus]|uniref:Uncharacterized protein n=1 Tax=Dimorphilus gyrociliatus TaxID=2664684 RepID=A0A7I8V6E0_9ANNE|nr:unnamed protein product [Dimorphilus gyrociliatus]